MGCTLSTPRSDNVNNIENTTVNSILIDYYLSDLTQRQNEFKDEYENSKPQINNNIENNINDVDDGDKISELQYEVINVIPPKRQLTRIDTREINISNEMTKKLNEQHIAEINSLKQEIQKINEEKQKIQSDLTSQLTDVKDQLEALLSREKCSIQSYDDISLLYRDNEYEKLIEKTENLKIEKDENNKCEVNIPELNKETVESSEIKITKLTDYNNGEKKYKKVLKRYIQLEKKIVVCSKCKLYNARIKCYITNGNEYICEECIINDNIPLNELSFCDESEISKLYKENCNNCKKEIPLIQFMRRKIPGNKTGCFAKSSICIKCDLLLNKKLNSFYPIDSHSISSCTELDDIDENDIDHLLDIPPPPVESVIPYTANESSSVENIDIPKLNIPPPPNINQPPPPRDAFEIYIEIEKQEVVCCKCKMHISLSQCLNKESKKYCEKCIKTMDKKETIDMQFINNIECNKHMECNDCGKKLPLYHFIKRNKLHPEGYKKEYFKILKICTKCRFRKSHSEKENKKISDIPPCYYENIDEYKDLNDEEKLKKYSKITMKCENCGEKKSIFDGLYNGKEYYCQECLISNPKLIENYKNIRTKDVPCEGDIYCEYRLHHYVPSFYAYQARIGKICLYCKMIKSIENTIFSYLKSSKFSSLKCNRLFNSVSLDNISTVSSSSSLSIFTDNSDEIEYDDRSSVEDIILTPNTNQIPPPSPPPLNTDYPPSNLYQLKMSFDEDNESKFNLMEIDTEIDNKKKKCGNDFDDDDDKSAKRKFSPNCDNLNNKKEKISENNIERNNGNGSDDENKDGSGDDKEDDDNGDDKGDNNNSPPSHNNLNCDKCGKYFKDDIIYHICYDCFISFNIDTTPTISSSSSRSISTENNDETKSENAVSSPEEININYLFNIPPSPSINQFPRDAFEIYIEIEKQEVQCDECKMHVSLSQCLNKESIPYCVKCIMKMNKKETIDMEFVNNYACSDKYIECNDCGKELPAYHFIKRKKEHPEGYKKEYFKILKTCAKCRFRKNHSEKEDENIFDIPPFYYENIDEYKGLSDKEKLKKYSKIPMICEICEKENPIIDGLYNGKEFNCQECLKNNPLLMEKYKNIRTKDVPCEGDVYCDYILRHYVPPFFISESGKNCLYCKMIKSFKNYKTNKRLIIKKSIV